MSFFMPGIVDSARFTPRGALRLNHLFGADAPLMQVNLPVPLLNESTSSHQKREIPMLSFFVRKSVDEEPLQSNRSHRPKQQRCRCALCLTLHYTMQRFAVYLKTVQSRGYPPLSKNRGVFFCIEKTALSDGFCFGFGFD